MLCVVLTHMHTHVTNPSPPLVSFQAAYEEKQKEVRGLTKGRSSLAAQRGDVAKKMAHDEVSGWFVIVCCVRMVSRGYVQSWHASHAHTYTIPQLIHHPPTKTNHDTNNRRRWSGCGRGRTRSCRRRASMRWVTSSQLG